VPDIDEPIVIVPYDPSWPALFDEERRRITPALGDIVTGVEHFGSTAVPGMAGKPIVDLLVGVADLALASSRIAGLERLGYENFGEIFIPGRIYLRRRGACPFNIAMTLEGGAFWDSQLVLRDYLRVHPTRQRPTCTRSKRHIRAEHGCSPRTRRRKGRFWRRCTSAPARGRARRSDDRVTGL
jgi:GrpB-like predicted nucleotidyltransferase (UPF0157 family)